MDGVQDRLKFLGPFGMFGESFQVISARKKLFAHTLLAFILPLSFFFLAQSIVTQLILKTDDYSWTDGGYTTLDYKKDGWAVILAIKVVYFTIVVILSLLATSAVAYAVACHYASRDIGFKEVAKTVLVPAVWKRLIITFLWTYLVFVVFNLILVGLIFSCSLLLATEVRPLGIILVALLLIVYIIGIVYIGIVSELAYVVSVLDNGVYGKAAMSKSRTLLKGKLWSVIGCLVLLMVCYGLVEAVFIALISVGNSIKIMALSFVVGVVFLSVVAFEHLVALVMVTVFYIVCKSYHQESLDTSHLTSGGPVVPRELAKEVQLEEQYQV